MPVGNPTVGEVWRVTAPGEVWRVTAPGETYAFILAVEDRYTPQAGATRSLRIQLRNATFAAYPVVIYDVDAFLHEFEWVSGITPEMLPEPARTSEPGAVIINTPLQVISHWQLTDEQHWEPTPPPITHRRSQWEHLLVDEDAPVPVEEVPPTELPDFITNGVQSGDRGIIGVIVDPLTRVEPLTPTIDIDPTTVTLNVVREAWVHRTGPFTIHPNVYQVIQRAGLNPLFDIETHIELIRTGLVAYFSGGAGPAPIYVSRLIPYLSFYEGPRIPELFNDTTTDYDPSPELLRAFQASLPRFFPLPPRET